ncbi:glutamate receptor 1-like [Centruroides sculpturatus]|uniref:glutamate receptor 1-like n=1 Tax=Centruroides sculpturatus TaxID=218467 RepID=UPI000C6DABCA|nr:glutamate receptor 1-like [Centruroides sculpturatus]
MTIISVTLILPPIINYELNKREISHRWTIKTSFWFLFSSFTNQGSDISYIKRMFARIAIGTCSVTILILTFSYSGTLTSHLTAPGEEPVPKTFAELVDYVKKGKFACGMTDSAAFYDLIMNSDKGFVKELKDHMVANNNIFSIINFVQRAKEGRIAILSYSGFVKSFRSRDDDKWLISEDSMTFIQFGYPMRKGFPLKKQFDYMISRLFETGSRSPRLSKKGYIKANVKKEFEALNLTNFLGAFYLLVSGYLVAIIFFTLEVFIGKRAKAVPDQDDNDKLSVCCIRIHK